MEERKQDIQQCGRNQRDTEEPKEVLRIFEARDEETYTSMEKGNIPVLTRFLPDRE